MIGHWLWQLELISRWLEREQLSPGELTSERVEEFLAGRRAAGFSMWLSVQSMSLPLEFLREFGVVPTEPTVAVDDPLEGAVGGVPPVSV